MIKGAKTIAEYAIRKWMIEHNFVMEYFSVSVKGDMAIITDRTGDMMFLLYDRETKSVSVVDDIEVHKI